MNKIAYKTKVPFMKVLFGLVIFALGLYWFSNGALFGIAISVMSIFFIHSEGSEIDFKAKKYRAIISYFGFNFGEWKDLPKIDYVTVLTTIETTTDRLIDVDSNIEKTIFQLNLIYNENQKITAYKTPDPEEAFKIAKKIAKKWNTKLLDATIANDYKWIDKEAF